jgi:hypothetical protein
MNTNKNLELILNELVRQNVPDDIKKLAEETSKNFSKNLLPSRQRILWEKIMQSKLTKLAAAATIIIAAMLGIHHFGGSIDGTSVAWANMAHRVEQIPSYIYRFRNTESSGHGKEGFEFAQKFEEVIYASSEYGIKIEHEYSTPLWTISYLLRNEGVSLWVCPPEKLYTRNSLNELQLQQMYEGPREVVKRFMLTKYSRLGHKMVDGVEVEGIEGYDPNVLFVSPVLVPPPGKDFAARLWVDIKTQLPVSLELEYTQQGSTLKQRIIMDRFQWDVNLSSNIFEPNIPVDYVLYVPPQKPEKTVAVVEQSVDPCLPNLGNLTLPGIQGEESNKAVLLLGYEQIWRTQNEIMSAWPAYSEVKEQLSQELSQKLGIEKLPSELLVRTALALRKKYWDTGGDLSKVSYPYGYSAYLLLESAHKTKPEDMDITDELVETMLSIDTRLKYTFDSKEQIKNIELLKRLIELRTDQFEQIKKEIMSGREPEWKDFVRVNDLVALFGHVEDYEAGLEVLGWLLTQANRGGWWTTYLPEIQETQEHFRKCDTWNWTIYTVPLTAFPEEYRYARRLPSFRGPAKRGIIPVHVFNPNYFGGKRIHE